MCIPALASPHSVPSDLVVSGSRLAHLEDVRSGSDEAGCAATSRASGSHDAWTDAVPPVKRRAGAPPSEAVAAAADHAAAAAIPEFAAVLAFATVRAAPSAVPSQTQARTANTDRAAPEAVLVVEGELTNMELPSQAVQATTPAAARTSREATAQPSPHSQQATARGRSPSQQTVPRSPSSHGIFAVFSPEEPLFGQEWAASGEMQWRDDQEVVQ
eukprot:CAMPEP_0194493948 /NCGR_PEP_ID=MMETSP0253-20130528/12006_1 /TAXON_ID=2966 /ORGANISM="Noctiluca scintillans" /LENGTH=214 /DNA_ID=CAMNT_0039334991 /DNA_START=356 /DNA_END=1001 /DNA_ORIENTATION=+